MLSLVIWLRQRLLELSIKKVHYMLVRLVNQSTTFENVVLPYVYINSELKRKLKQLQIVEKRTIVKLYIRSCRMCLKLFSVENTFYCVLEKSKLHLARWKARTMPFFPPVSTWSLSPWTMKLEK